MQKYTTQELMILINKLPNVTSKKGPTISSSVIAGLTTRLNNRFCLIDATFNGGRLTGFKPDPKIDLRTQNSYRRKLLSFDQGNDGFRKTLNQALAGGESFPVLTTIGGIGLGVISAGVGIAFSLGTLLLEESKIVQPVRTRLGDEIWQVEQLARDGTDVYHVEYFMMLDPFRIKDNAAKEKEWIIHETRRKINWGSV